MKETIITFEFLKDLCRQYHFEIGKGLFHLLPQITIRYIDSKCRFGYTSFGNFFFLENDMYVWKENEECKEEHNQYVVEEVFGVECKDRGYACRRIFSGVKTNFKDSNNDYIYTGDVLKLSNGLGYNNYNLSVGAIVFDNIEHKGYYGFLLDNHSWDLTSCMKEYSVTRIGSIFFQIDETAQSEDINFRTLLFNNNNYDDIDEETKLIMASYTPNTDKEIWKYRAYGILGIEPWFE